MNTGLPPNDGNIIPISYPSQVCFNPLIECVINKLSIFLGNGSDIVEQILNYNQYASGTYKYRTSLNYADTIGNEIHGYSITSDRIAEANSPTGTNYAVPLIGSGLFGGLNLRYLPMGLLAGINGYSRSLRIEITLEDPNVCMQNFSSVTSAGAFIGTRNYVLNDVYLNLEIIKAPQYELHLMNEVKNGKTIHLPLVTCDQDVSFINNLRTGNVNFPMLKQRQWVQGVRTMFLGQNTDPQFPFTWEWSQPENILTYQYQIMNKWYPPEPVKLSSDNIGYQVTELLKYFNKLKEYYNGTLVTAENIGSAEQLDIELTYQNLTFGVNPLPIIINGISFNNFTFNTLSPAIRDPTNLLWMTSNGGLANPDRFNIKFNNIDVNYNFDFVLQFRSQNPALAVVGASLQIGLWDAGANAFVPSLNTVLNVDLPVGYADFVDIPVTISGSTNTLQTLIAGVHGDYEFRAQTFGDNNLQTRIDYGRVELSGNLEDMSDPQIVNFLLGQTMKVFYDQDQYALGEYIVDGVSTMQNSAIQLNLNIGAGGQSLSVLNYIDYLEVIMIDNTGISVIR